ncbi:MAG TPA: serine/threonine-protein kinase, partial [Enhygromyxa sp.]|nr:serine/threonine-protein kinase [Enhygromyxa sp.]
MRSCLHVETQDSEPDHATTDEGSDANEPTTLEHDGVLRLGRYPIVRKLGEGGMGIVYACYDEALDRRIAIKLLNSRFQRRSSRTRLEREAQALARLSHPNVVHIYEFGLHGDSLYLAMEYIDGQTLREWLRGSDRRWREIAEVLVQAGRGLAAAHAAGLVHRDFKPDNVMVGRDGRVRVLDFGLVRVLQETASDLDDEPEHSPGPSEPWLTRPGTILGTPAYMAPEQHAGRPSDAKADQFAWCVVAYEAMFGVRPFAGSSAEAIAEAIRAGRWQTGEDRLGVPRRVRAAIVR